MSLAGPKAPHSPRDPLRLQQPGPYRARAARGVGVRAARRGGGACSGALPCALGGGGGGGLAGRALALAAGWRALRGGGGRRA